MSIHICSSVHVFVSCLSASVPQWLHVCKCVCESKVSVMLMLSARYWTIFSWGDYKKFIDFITYKMSDRGTYYTFAFWSELVYLCTILHIHMYMYASPFVCVCLACVAVRTFHLCNFFCIIFCLPPNWHVHCCLTCESVYVCVCESGRVLSVCSRNSNQCIYECVCVSWERASCGVLFA